VLGGARSSSAPDGGVVRPYHPDMNQIASIAEHVSTTERVAADAEIESARMKKLEFFQRQLDQRNPQIFRAAIVDVRNYGLAVELPDALITGLVHVSSLNDDFYVFDPSRRQLVGRRTRKRFSIGDEVRVFVVRVDIFKRQIDFAIASDERKKRDRSRERLGV
jgi:ribonuclease R